MLWVGICSGLNCWGTNEAPRTSHGNVRMNVNPFLFQQGSHVTLCSIPNQTNWSQNSSGVEIYHLHSHLPFKLACIIIECWLVNCKSPLISNWHADWFIFLRLLGKIESTETCAFQEKKMWLENCTKWPNQTFQNLGDHIEMRYPHCSKKRGECG